MTETRFLELVPHFQCNSNCVYCFRPDFLKAQTLSPEQTAAGLRQGRAEGRTGLWVGGGEPTLWPLLPKVLKAGVKLGYEELIIQSNGWRLGDPAYLGNLMEAGLTGIRLSLYATPGPDYDRITQRPDATELLELAIVQATKTGLTLETDLVIHKDHLNQLPQTLTWLSNRGITTGLLWFISLFGMENTDQDVRHLLPSFEEISPQFPPLFSHAESIGFQLRVLHLPPCLYPQQKHLFLSPSDWDIRIVTPGGNFLLPQSPFEGGAYVSACQSCNVRGHCPGLRQDYLKHHPDPQIIPL